MSETTLNLVAVTIFTLVMTSLLGPLLHISPVIPAVATFGILGVATLDTLNWQGQLGTLFVDWFNQFSPDHRNRVVRHEAGHFLAAHLLEIPVTGYTLTAWAAFRQGQAGLGGVSFELPEPVNLEQGVIPAQWVDRYCTVWMAGAVAETLVYGEAQGGADDRQKFRMLWAQFKRPDAEGALKERWATLQAKTLLQTHWAAYEALVQAMETGATVEECRSVIEHHRTAET